MKKKFVVLGALLLMSVPAFGQDTDSSLQPLQADAHSEVLQITGVVRGATQDKATFDYVDEANSHKGKVTIDCSHKNGALGGLVFGQAAPELSLDTALVMNSLSYGKDFPLSSDLDSSTSVGACESNWVEAIADNLSKSSPSADQILVNGDTHEVELLPANASAANN